MDAQAQPPLLLRHQTEDAKLTPKPGDLEFHPHRVVFRLSMEQDDQQAVLRGPRDGYSKALRVQIKHCLEENQVFLQAPQHACCQPQKPKRRRHICSCIPPVQLPSRIGNDCPPQYAAKRIRPLKANWSSQNNAPSIDTSSEIWSDCHRSTIEIVES